ncbi:acyl-CoA dehydrogenase [Pigmentiphaga litoralis]|uniref:acyl-CoA dehydrogenase n=1 Tax=Pigmentiphaga litoralis TaxID=516702 RepID=UPI001679530C|nr:acyl-CoA dehydrogenase [Pigmentiphaga litoralis]GGX34537.1 acyl-CoA dehydrogenase [Pigmentiphaga litoralis]
MDIKDVLQALAPAGGGVTGGSTPAIDPDDLLRDLVSAGLGAIALPGVGNTLARWRLFAAVAERDLAAIKLVEGHADALAILAELDGPDPAPGSLWATWSAEPPTARVQARPGPDGGAVLTGTKAWCSGAAAVTHAVVSAWNADGKPVLVAVAMNQPGVTVTDRGWHAVGMEATYSVEVDFAQADAHWVGRPGQYVGRPGFWHGGAGIAACWYGGACAIANAVRHACAAAAHRPDNAAPSGASAALSFRLAHLGAIEVALGQTASLLREAAAWIDAHPKQDAMAIALRVRASAEATATLVLDHAGRALGATPYCRDPRYARMAADLPVFIRQSHAEQDLAALARTQLDAPENSWGL